ncbi:MAG: hypothetical protein IKP58_01100 [Victivallales bacterium]|nr:hypothetical protein [Victivallales bacterium]
MMKLNASYSKKVPADAEYSSQQYHCQIEAELSDGLTPEQIQARIHETFGMVRDAVEAELQASRQTAPAIQPPQMPPPQPQQYAQPQYQQPMPPQNGYAQQPVTQNGYVQQQPVQQPRQYQQGGAKAKGKNEGNATSKQIEYLLKLMKGSTWTVDGLKLNYNISRLEDLTSEQASYLINQLKSNAA